MEFYHIQKWCDKVFEDRKIRYYPQSVAPLVLVEHLMSQFDSMTTYLKILEGTIDARLRLLDEKLEELHRIVMERRDIKKINPKKKGDIDDE